MADTKTPTTKRQRASKDEAATRIEDLERLLRVAHEEAVELRERLRFQTRRADSAERGLAALSRRG